LFGLRFQNKVGVAMIITGIASMVDFVLALIWTYPSCSNGNPTGCERLGSGLAQNFGLLLILGILLIGFGIATVLFDWNPITFQSKKSL
jgi:hypothetical protein